MDKNVKYEFSEFYNYKNLTKTREIHLFKNLNKMGYRDEIIKSHLKLVLKISKPYRDKFPNLFCDIIQEGVVGLLEAVSFFDLSYNCRFSTISSYLIRNKIRDFLRKNKVNTFVFNENDFIEDISSFLPENIDKKEKIKKIKEAIYVLADDKDINIINLKYNMNQPWRKISESLGGSYEGLRKKHMRLILKIKENLEFSFEK